MLKKKIYHLKFASIVVDHLHGEKSGKKIGKKLNFVVKNAESKKNSIGLV